MIWDIIENLDYKIILQIYGTFRKWKNTLKMFRELVLQSYSSLFLTVMLFTKYLEKSS